MDYEESISQRIRILEEKDLYNLPLQSRRGEYEEIVRSHFDQARSTRYAMDLEYRAALQTDLEKAVVQEKLFSMMIEEENHASILQLSPYSNIRKETF